MQENARLADRIQELSTCIDLLHDIQEENEDKIGNALTKEFNSVFLKDLGKVRCDVIMFSNTNIVVLIHTLRKTTKDSEITFGSRINYRIKLEFDYMKDEYLQGNYKSFKEVEKKIQKFLIEFFRK